MWLAFGVGVAVTLAIEFALAHYFQWSADKQIAKIDAQLKANTPPPWLQRAEQEVVKDFKVVQSWIHPTPVLPANSGIVSSPPEQTA